MNLRSAPIVSLIIAAVGLFVLVAPSAGQETPPKIDATMGEEVFPYVYMSKDAYYDKAAIDIPGWTRIDNWEGVFTKLGELQHHVNGKKLIINDAKSAGFYAAIYKKNDNPDKGAIATAYRGSRNLLNYNDWVKTNIPASIGPPPAQYRYSAALATAVQNVYDAPSYSATGLSKGGGQATYAAQWSEGKKGTSLVVTFNSASPRFLSLPTPRQATRQINVVVPGDFVGTAKDSIVGRGHLPGQTVSVDSTTAYVPNTFPHPPENPSKLRYAHYLGTHNIDGVIGGLCSVTLSSSCLSLQAGSVRTGPVRQQFQPPATGFGPSSTPSEVVSPPFSQAPTTIARAPPTVHTPAATPPPNGRTDWTGINPEPKLSGTPTNPWAPVVPRSNPSTIVPNQAPSPAPRTAPLAPGGISLSKAAAARMPLNIALDGAYYTLCTSRVGKKG